MLVKCTAKVSNRNMITLVWVIAKLKSNTESPYHPAICSFKKAKCLSKMYNCINGNGIYKYYGHRAVGTGEGRGSNPPLLSMIFNNFNVSFFIFDQLVIFVTKSLVDAKEYTNYVKFENKCLATSCSLVFLFVSSFKNNSDRPCVFIVLQNSMSLCFFSL